MLFLHFVNPMTLWGRNMKHGKISHEGIVDAVTEQGFRVKILQTSACAACKVHGHCSAAESKEKTVDVRNTSNANYQVGDKVVVSMTTGDGRDAILLAFVLPFVIMVVVLVVCLLLTHNEAIAALSGIGALIPYYLTLFLLKEKITQRFTFRLE